MITLGYGSANIPRILQEIPIQKSGKNHSTNHPRLDRYTLHETNISHLGKRKIIFKKGLGRGYVMIPWRVCSGSNAPKPRKTDAPRLCGNMWHSYWALLWPTLECWHSIPTRMEDRRPGDSYYVNRMVLRIHATWMADILTMGIFLLVLRHLCMRSYLKGRYYECIYMGLIWGKPLGYVLHLLLSLPSVCFFSLMSVPFQQCSYQNRILFNPLRHPTPNLFKDITGCWWCHVTCLGHPRTGRRRHVAFHRRTATVTQASNLLGTLADVGRSQVIHQDFTTESCQVL